MEYRSIRMALKRDIRHARYKVSQCTVDLSARLLEGEDLEAAKNEMYEDLLIIMEEMEIGERKAYQDKKEGLKTI